MSVAHRSPYAAERRNGSPDERDVLTERRHASDQRDRVDTERDAVALRRGIVQDGRDVTQDQRDVAFAQESRNCTLCQITANQLWTYIAVGAAAWGGVAATLYGVTSELSELKASVRRIEDRISQAMPIAPRQPLSVTPPCQPATPPTLALMSK